MRVTSGFEFVGFNLFFRWGIFQLKLLPLCSVKRVVGERLLDCQAFAILAGFRCQLNKANPRKEFFRVDLAQIRTEIERLGIDTKWTLAAEAREYRESLAIEQALANNTLDRAEWEKFQLENAPTEEAIEADELEA